MKMKKFGMIFLLVMVLAIAAIAVPALAALEEPVVYLDGDTTDTVRDGSFAHPCKTLAEAYTALGSAGGTIVLCDDYTIDTDDWTVSNSYGYHLKFPVTTNKVTITGKDDTTDYGTTLYVDPDNSNSVKKKAHFLIYSPLEFSHLTLDHKKNSFCMEIYSGPELTFGEDMEMTVNGSTLTANDDIGVRLGYFSFPSGSGLSASNANCSVTMKSGSVSYLQGGNDRVGINSSSITLEGSAEVLGTLQCGGTRKSVNTSSVTINGAKVNELYLGGYSDSEGTASLASVTLTAVDAEITKLCGSRPTNGMATTVSGDVKVTLDNTTVGTADVSGLTVNGNKELALRNGDYSSLTTTGWAVADYTDWTTVYVDSGYDGGNSDGTAERPFTDINSAIGAVNTAYGADSTVPGGLILLTGDLTTITGEHYALKECDVPLYVTSVSPADRQTIVFGDSSGKNFVCCTTPITFEDVIFQLGGSANAEIWTGESLTIGDNVTFYLQDGVTEPNDTSNGRVSIRTGGKSYLAEARLEMNSGSVSLIQGGNSDATVGHATLILNEGVNVSWFVQCGGTSQKNGYDADGKLLENGGTDLQVNGATINILYLNGHGTSHNNIVNAVVKDATVNTIAYNRSGAAATTQELNLTLDNATVGSLCSLGDEVTASSLTLLPSEDTYATLTAGITGWEKTAPVLLDTVYVKDAGDDENGDGSADAPVATLETAYALVKNGGTIVLCGDLSITANGIYSLPEKTVTITGQSFDPVLTFDSNSDGKLHVQFKAATTLEKITINRGEKLAGYPRCLELWTGPSLALGDGVKMTNNGAELTHHTDGQIAVRIGDRTMSDSTPLPSGSYSQLSGTVSFIQGGNNHHKVVSSTITLGGSAIVLDMLQCGGTGKDVGASTVEISGNAQIAEMYVNGYGSASMGSSQIEITGGTVESIRAGRSRKYYNDSQNKESDGDLGSVTLTIGGTANVKEIDFWNQEKMNLTGTNALTFQDIMSEMTLTSGFGTGWTSITVGDNSIINLMSAYVNSGTLNMKDGAILYLNSDNNVNSEPLPAYNKTGTAQTGKVLLKQMHNIVPVAATEPGVFTDGCKAHYKCTACGTCYSDARGENVQDYVTQIKIPATGYGVYHEYVDGSNFQLTPLLASTSSQGAAVHGNTLFLANNKGECKVYDLTTGKRIGGFDFESVTATSTDAWSNHSNSIMFSNIYYADDDPFPLLFVCAGNSGAHITDGSHWGAETVGSYYGHLAVERIFYDKATDSYSAKTVVRVFFNDTDYIPIGEGDNIDGTLKEMWDADVGGFPYMDNKETEKDESQYQKIGWGWPAWFVDSNPTAKTEGKLYLYSARFRTYQDPYEGNAQRDYGITNYKEDNAYIVTEIDMTGLIPTETENTENYGKKVILTPADIIDQFTTEYENGGTQGGTMYQGRIYYSYGFGAAGTNYHKRNFLQVFDISQKKIVSKVHMYLDEHSTNKEPECPAIWNGELIMSFAGGVYKFDYLALDESTVVAPTCTENGSTYIECSLCGHNLKTLDTENALDHSFTNYVSDGNATCEADGTKTAVCDRDGCEETHTVADTDSKLGHSFTDYKSDGNATCTEDGTKTAKCDRCDKTDTVKETAHGHKLTKVDGKAATCTEDGVTEHYNCSVCKKNFSDAEGKTALSTTVIPSCHKLEKVAGKAPTVTENGHKEHYGCASCGKLFADAEGKSEVTKDSLVISATGAPTDTGDDFEAWPFIVLMLLSAAGVTVLVIGRKQWFKKTK